MTPISNLSILSKSSFKSLFLVVQLHVKAINREHRLSYKAKVKPSFYLKVLLKGQDESLCSQN